MNGSALLSLKNVCFSYDDRPEALCDVSVSIYEGERIAVIGNNGAGKSTFFLCCNGVLVPQKGGIYLHGQEVRPEKKSLNHLRRHVGIVFQDANQQLIGATTEEEISFGPMNMRLAPEEVGRRVEEVIEQMGLDALRQRPPHYLSGGEKKRLSIAGVLVMLPELILLDEPTAFLDVRNTLLLENTLHDLHKQGKTLVVATHDIDFAGRWATRVLMFMNGRLIADAPPHDIFNDKPLLEKVGIRQPVIYEFAQALLKKGLISSLETSPATLDELLKLL